MPRRADHWVIPECVNGRPGEVVAVVLSKRPSRLGHHAATDPVTKKQAASLILHQQDDDEQQDDRPLRALLGNIQSQTIVEDVRLNEVKGDEDGVCDKCQDIDAA